MHREASLPRPEVGLTSLDANGSHSTNLHTDKTTMKYLSETILTNKLLTVAIPPLLSRSSCLRQNHSTKIRGLCDIPWLRTGLLKSSRFSGPHGAARGVLPQCYMAIRRAARFHTRSSRLSRPSTQTAACGPLSWHRSAATGPSWTSRPASGRPGGTRGTARADRDRHSAKAALGAERRPLLTGPEKAGAPRRRGNAETEAVCGARKSGPHEAEVTSRQRGGAGWLRLLLWHWAGG